MKKVLIILIVLIVLAGIYFGLRFLIDKSKLEPVACTMEAKLCPDGSYVSRIPPKCDFAPCPKEDLIQVESPIANETISSPLIVKGRARGNWFFEASFPVKLLDENGNILAQTYASAKGDWMTTEFVSFEAEIVFSAPSASKGILILEKDNPSGLPEHADELRIPVFFELATTTKTIKLYYYNPERDKDETGNTKCSRDGLVAIEREIPITKTPIQDAIKLLLKGKENLTEAEKVQGITTEYPLEGFSLKSASLKDGVLTL
ncbi:MAG: Gmad2 immunoglobulin-like domain-containing protein, partial [Minisyncoccales bacterium]